MTRLSLAGTCCTNVNKTGADGTIGSGAWRTNEGCDAHESVDGDDDTAQDAHSWSDREECDGYEVRMQEMEARVNILMDNLPKISSLT